jgi:hypothetical protein
MRDPQAITRPALPTQLSPPGLLSVRHHILTIHLLYGHHLARLKSLTRRHPPLLRQRPSHQHAHAQTARSLLRYNSYISEPHGFPLTCSQVTTPHLPTAPTNSPPTARPQSLPVFPTSHTPEYTVRRPCISLQHRNQAFPSSAIHVVC